MDLTEFLNGLFSDLLVFVFKTLVNGTELYRAQYICEAWVYINVITMN